MEKQKKFSIKARMQSFTFAFSGLKVLFKEEHNSWIHAIFAIVAVGLGLLLRISLYEWVAVLFAIALVFSLELINSAIENLADCITQEKNEYIRKAKDLAAAAVFVSAIISLFIGIIIFLPKLIDLIF